MGCWLRREKKKKKSGLSRKILCFENVATEILLLFSAFANTLGVNVSHCVVDKTACCVLLPHVYNFSSKDLENCKSVNQIGKNTQFTSLYFLPYQNHPPLILKKKKKKSHSSTWKRGGYRGGWMHVYMRLSPFAVHLQLSQTFLTGCTPVKNKKL